MSINEKILNIQNELKAPKSQWNNFGKYNYRNAEDILEARKPLLKKEGVILTLTDEIVLIGSRYYVKSTATVKYADESIVVSAYAREEENKKVWMEVKLLELLKLCKKICFKWIISY